MMLVLAACGSGNKGTPADSILSGMDSGSGSGSAAVTGISHRKYLLFLQRHLTPESPRKRNTFSLPIFSQAGEQYGVGVVEKGNTR